MRAAAAPARVTRVPGQAAADRLKPPPDRLYGRGRGHKLRARQETLLARTLPRLAFHPQQAADPLAAFAPGLRRLWLEVGFGGGEHALAQIAAHPDTALIACEVFDNGICSLLSRLVPEGQEATAPLPGNLRLWPQDARVLLRALPDGQSRSVVPAVSRPLAEGAACQAPLRASRAAAGAGAGAEARAPSGASPATTRPIRPGSREVMGRQTLFDAPPSAGHAPGGLAADALRGQGAAGGPGAALLDLRPALTPRRPAGAIGGTQPSSTSGSIERHCRGSA